MSALRRDLLERRLWPLVAVLIAAVLAVPVLLLTSAPTTGAGVQAPPNVVLPHVVLPGTTAGAGASTNPDPILLARVPRNPFASGMPTLTPKPQSSAATSSPASTPASMVTPSPASSGSQSTVTTSTTATGSVSPQGTSTGATSTTTSTTTTSTAPPATTPATTPATAQSWTIHAVDLRVGKNAQAPVRRDLARLTLLPSVKLPELMFMGVIAGGRQAVFALGGGVLHRGPGLCKPSRQACSTIVLRAGQAELISIPTAGGGQWQLILRLVHVRSRITTSQSEALAAYKRQSAAGQCDLDLAKPMSYSQSEGTLSAAAGQSCRNQPAAVPFPSAAHSQ